MASYTDRQTADASHLLERAARGDLSAAQLLRGMSLEWLFRRSEGLPAEAVAGGGLRVAICVCTATRPKLLSHCLQSITLQIVPHGAVVHLVVVDNESEPNNRNLVMDFSIQCPFPVHYVHEPRTGVPLARNAALEKCRDIGVDWIAFTDDDCWVTPAWLGCLLDTARRHRIDVVYGRREFLFPLPLPRWRIPAEHGSNLDFVSTRNVLLAGWLVGHQGAQHKMSFDDRLTRGEDTDFFYRAASRGARIIYMAEPAVFEAVSAERATLTHQARRTYCDAASRSYCQRRYRGVVSATVKLGVRGLFHMPMAVMGLVIAPFAWLLSEATFRGLITKSTAHLAGVAGAAAGLVGFSGGPSRRMDER
jgi:succinoglycan biosynthesis protein ExoM